MQDLIIKEELRTLLPPLSAEEYAGLEADILRDGCLSPLTVWNGILIDGHNRYDICKKHRITFSTNTVVLDNLDDAKLWAWKHQEHRRNLTAYHRAELTLKLKDVIATKAKERQKASGGDRKSEEAKSVPPKSAEPVTARETRQELAEIAMVAPSTLGQVEYISNHADEETKDKLRRGEKGTSINKEYNRLKEEARNEAAAPVDTIAAEPENVETSEEQQTYSEPPCPNKHIKYFPKTTLKNISQETPQILLANLFAHFRKGFVEELVIMAMEKINEKLGKAAVMKILRELNKRYEK